MSGSFEGAKHGKFGQGAFSYTHHFWMVTEGTRISGTTDYLPQKLKIFSFVLWIYTNLVNYVSYTHYVEKLRVIFFKSVAYIYIYYLWYFSLHVLYSIIGMFLFSLQEEYWAHNFRLMSQDTVCPRKCILTRTTMRYGPLGTDKNWYEVRRCNTTQYE